ncbi:hypothetical protein Caci_6165 [Catenulispora acidiphila DSM 44928]|uniref:Uncharacterized protein n=1 Tax=Catenulispora acidiphila (strain DSM 44928 / JCM 14897 / NBRC 102108 / NRRL B-24433 / ID139908) TaxID=479433 RepID=C7QIE2_CATAD|nr:hypothetical protein [Catenulispora acidiphila]ACU75019.1 hypothetical protein Caci_6165 [Catenulispora acidiphila DSM 44928]
MTTNRGFICGTALVEGEFDAYSEDEFYERRIGSRAAIVPPPPPAPLFGDRPSMEHYERALRHFTDHPDSDGALTHLRDLTVQGLRAGTLTAHDLLFEVRPAAVAVAVLAEPDVAGTGAVLAAVIRAAVGERASRWAYLVDQVALWTGSLSSLLVGRDDTGIGDHLSVPPSPPNVWTGHWWRPANIMLALAPLEDGRRFFTEAIGRTAIRRAGAAQAMAGCMPLSRALVEHTLSPRGRLRARVNLAGNAFTPDVVLAELLNRAGEPAIATAVRAHDFADGELRHQAFLAVRDRPEAVRKSLGELLEHGQRQFLDLLAAVPDDDATWLHTLIKLAGEGMRPDARREAYSRLAAVSGPEVVWSLELARVGSLEAMAPEVRASMAESSAEPLAAAVRERPFRDPEATINAAAAEMRREGALDRPLPWLGSGQAKREA